MATTVRVGMFMYGVQDSEGYNRPRNAAGPEFGRTFSKSSVADEECLGLIRHQREEVVAALRLTRMQLRSAREVLGPPLALWCSYRIRESTRPSS